MYCIWHIHEFNLCLLLVPAPPSLLFSSTISSSTQYLTAFSAAMSLTKSNIPLLSNYYNHCRPGCLFSQVFSQKCQVFFCPSCPSVCPPSVPCPFHFLNKYLKRNVKFDCRILKYVPKQDSWPNQIKINKKSAVENMNVRLLMVLICWEQLSSSCIDIITHLLHYMWNKRFYT